MDINYSLLPEHMRGGMRRYIEQGILPGGFLQAVLSDSLSQSGMRADDVNRERLLDYAHFLYEEAPLACWGSEEAVRKWVEMGGLKGMGLLRSEATKGAEK